MKRLLCALLLVALPAAARAMPVRVALVESARAVELTGASIAVDPVGRCQGCGGRTWETDVVRAVVSGAQIEIGRRRAPAFRLRSEALIRLNGREYQGTLELLRNGDGLAVVNELPLEEYVAGVVRGETGERWPIEALRAQAIAARTYTAHQRALSLGKPYHLVASTAHQQFAGRVATSSPVWNAVLDTAGQVILLDGEIFPAFYHAESGGYTEDPRQVFTPRNMPALRAVRDEFADGSPHFYWRFDLRLADLAEILRRNQVPVGQVTDIEVTERTLSLRVVSLIVHGSAGSAPLRGVDFRRMVGYENVRSTLFAVTIEDGVARFSGRGYGHGIGMPQWSARTMALQGYTAVQILDYYYPGTTLGLLRDR